MTMAGQPAWWPSEEQKRHADAGCAHPDSCNVREGCMTMFELEIRTDNAAFSDGESEFAGPELARILRKLAERVEGGIPTGDGARLYDVNGASVGEWSYASEDGVYDA